MSDLRHVLRRMSERFSWLADHHVTSDFAERECRKLADECWQAQATADQPSPAPGGITVRVHGRGCNVERGKSCDCGAADNGSPAPVKHTRMCATWSVIEGLPCTCGAVPSAEQRDE